MSQQQTSEWIPTGNSAGNNGPGNNGAGKDTAVPQVVLSGPPILPLPG